MKSLFFKFFYSNLISLGLYIGGKSPKSNVDNLISWEYNKFACLDIKQSFKELNKILLLVEFLASVKGKLLIFTGPYSLLEKDLPMKLFCNFPNLVTSPDVNFPGMISNFFRPTYGIPSLVFVPNSVKSWYITTECASFLIPVICLVSLDTPKPLINLISYRILSNTSSSAIYIFFFLLILFSFTSFRRKYVFFKIFNKKVPLFFGKK